MAEFYAALEGELEEDWKVEDMKIVKDAFSAELIRFKTLPHLTQAILQSCGIPLGLVAAILGVLGK